MSAAHDFARYADDSARAAEDAPTSAEQTSTLTGRLDAKLAELSGKGFAIQWLEIAESELVTLFSEGGDEVIRLDSDPAVDKAWYGDIEVRPTERGYIWIFLEGEVEGEVSAHVVS